MKFIKYFAALAFSFLIVVSASEQKKIKKSFPVTPGQSIEIYTVSGLDVKVRSWDKDEVMFDLKMRIESSDDDFEREYLEEFDIVDDSKGSTLVIKFDESESDGSWNFWDIFKFKFGFSLRKEIKGEIFVPKNSPLYSDFRYSNIYLDGMAGELILDGRSNELELVNCSSLKEIVNHYGNIKIQSSAGKLEIDTRSSELNIKDFSGPLRIDADYSNCKLSKIGGSVDLGSRSAELSIRDVEGDLIVDAHYSNMEIENINGFTDVTGRSATIKIKNTSGLKVAAPYSNLYLADIKKGDGLTNYIENRSGLIEIINMTGNLKIEDQYSNMNFTGITGDVVLTSRSSTIRAKEVKGNWKANTQYCVFDLYGFYSDDIFIENRSGDIDLKLIKAVNRIEIENTYGGIDIEMPRGFSGTCDLAATYGEIDTNLKLRVRTQGSSANAYGSIGSGAGEIKLETRSENIKLIEK